MATMTRRLQVLLDEERYALLERESQRTGRPVAELVRAAVDSRYGTDRTARQAAFQQILAAEGMPVEDWDVMKRDLLDSLHGDTAP